MRNYGFLYALLYSAFAIGGAIGPAMAGIMFDVAHNYVTALSLMAVLLTFGALSILTLPKFPIKTV
jgi:MFS family permease